MASINSLSEPPASGWAWQGWSGAVGKPHRCSEHHPLGVGTSGPPRSPHTSFQHLWWEVGRWRDSKKEHGSRPQALAWFFLSENGSFLGCRASSEKGREVLSHARCDVRRLRQCWGTSSLAGHN